MSSISSSTYDLLHACTVRIVVRPGQRETWGTGFFVAPGWVLTCAHVVAKNGHVADEVWIFHEDGRSAAVIVDLEHLYGGDYPDLVLLRLDMFHNPAFLDHPVLMLDGTVKPRDSVYTYGFGYTKTRRPGASMTATVEGWAQPGGKVERKGKLIQLKEGQVLPGLSGAPLLSLETGAVCGVVKGTRDHATSLGGWAIPAWQVLDLYKRILGSPEPAPALRAVSARHTDVPELLLYDCDRVPQREKLKGELKQHSHDRPHRPFVCFVHGHQQECLEAFLEHAQLYILPEALNTEIRRIEHVQWADTYTHLSERVAEVFGNLMDRILRDRKASSGVLAATLAERLSPTVVSTHLYARDWHEQEHEVILEWLRFWRDFPDLPPNKGIYVFVNIQYESGHGWWWFLRMNRKLKKINNSLKLLNKTETSSMLGAGTERRLSLGILDELRPIPLSAAHTWVHEHGMRGCATYLLMIEKLNRIYQLRKHIPMQELADHLRTLLDECLPPGSES